VQPATNTRTVDPLADLRARWKPSDHQRATAAALLAADRDASRVVVPIALPGKTHGIWEYAQAVEPAPGFWLAADSDFHQHLSYRYARDAAEFAAEQHLGDRPGQPSYAVIRRDGTWAVFEGCRTPRPVISRTQLEEWAGRPLSNADVDRLAAAVSFSSIPEAIETIAAAIWKD